MKENPKSILIAPNSFKECSNSVVIASLIKENFTDDLYDTILRPLSDGGDGFLEVCKEKFSLELIDCEISSPYSNNKITCQIGINKSRQNIYIESAKILGLNLVPQDKRKPIELSSKGLGEIFKYIQQQFPEIEKIVIGVGGTGTNDLGLGAAGVFGLILLDATGDNLQIIPKNYINAKQIIWSDSEFPFKVEIVVDVDNLLLGEKGATRTFAKQKGALLNDIEVMEKGFENICDLLKRNNLINSEKELNGAGGGLAAGLQVFFNAEIKYAYDFIINELDIKSISPDIVIAGEGKFDSQTLMDKAPGIIINHFKNSKARVFVICGIAEEDIEMKIPPNVEIIEMKKYFKSVDESIKNFKSGLHQACCDIKKYL